MLYLSLLPLVFAYAFAANPCDQGNKTVSLFAPASTLASAKITDQDGLKTCGANAFALTLKSVTKNPKDFSYMDVALQGSKGFWGQAINPTKKFMLSEDRLAIEGAEDYCDTLKSINQGGGVCTQDNFSFESTVYGNWQGHDRAEKQFELLKALSTYLDAMNSHVVPQTVRHSDMAKVLKLIDDKKLSVAEKCAASGAGAADTDFKQGFQYLMGNVFSWISANQNDAARAACVRATQNYFNNFVTTPWSAADSHALDIKPSIVAAFKKGYKHALFMQQWKKNVNPLAHTFSIELARFIDRESAKGLTRSCNLTAADSDHPLSGKKLYVQELTKAVQKDLTITLSAAECTTRGMRDYLISKKAIKEAEAVCDNDVGLKELMTAMSIVPIWDNKLVEFMNRLGSSKATDPDDLTRLIAPNCIANRQKVDHLKCQRFSMMNRMEQKPLEEIRRQFRDVATDQIRAGRAVPMGICSYFLHDPTEDSMDSCLYKGNGYHGVAVTGYRCNGTSVEWEVANSWGRSCPLPSGLKDKNLECITDATGMPTGRYWVNEDALMKNVDFFNKVTP